MQTLESIQTRRAVKHYDPDFSIPEKDLNTILEHTLLSPTSYNIQHWRFVLVEDKALREKIQEASYGQTQVTEASSLVILCADVQAWAKNPERYWKDAPKEVQDILLPAIEGSYKNNPQFQRDEAIRSVGIAAQSLMLAATSMGYASCPMIGFDPEKVGKLIHLPEDHLIGMFVVIGKSLEPARGRAGQLPLEEVFIRNTF